MRNSLEGHSLPIERHDRDYAETLLVFANRTRHPPGPGRVNTALDKPAGFLRTALLFMENDKDLDSRGMLSVTSAISIEKET